MIVHKRVIFIACGGLLAILLLGLAFHELYKSTGITLLALISPVNESKWEHWKMACYPMLIISTIEYHFVKKDMANYIFALAMGIVTFELVTFGLIEFYDSFLGQAHLIVHVTTFLLGGITGQIVRYTVMLSTKPNRLWFIMGILILMVQVFAFSLFTWYPPRVDYFQDSITKTYGINAYLCWKATNR